MAKASDITRDWVVVDATDIPLGRLSAVVANILRGKNKPTYTPHVDTGDNVIIVNASKVKLTGKKASDKIYSRHTGYPAGLRQISAGELSIKGMLTNNKLGRKQIKKLHVYAGEEHKHAAQQPETLDITNLI